MRTGTFIAVVAFTVPFMLLPATAPADPDMPDRILQVTYSDLGDGHYGLIFPGPEGNNMELATGNSERIKFENQTSQTIQVRNTASPPGRPLQGTDPLIPPGTNSIDYAFTCDGDEGDWVFEIGDGPGGAEDCLFILSLICSDCSCPHHCDYDGNSILDPLDLNAMIDVLFFAGTDIHDPLCTTSRSDFDCSGFPDALDLNAMINHLFFGGAGPCDPCSP